jgi:predicted tellurium resistance membrane protein TerC
MAKTILLPILLIALTDIALQLDNALAISSVASGVPPGQRFFVLAGGVLLAACCLFVFTLIGSNLVERIAWLKPVAGLALIVIGGQLILNWFRA